MDSDWIIQYEVWFLDTGSGSEMYGHDRFVKSFDDCKTAVSYAKSLMPRHDNVCVKKVRYASERNLEKRLCFDSRFLWCAWIDGMDSEGDVE